MAPSYSRAAALLLGTALAACAATQPPVPVTGGRPRLAVVIVVDGMPQRQAVDYRDQLAPDGFERFFSRGAWFTEAHYGYANTETAPGHTTIATGANPHRSGIIANQWLDTTTGALTYCFGDSGATYIGHRTGQRDGTSPKNLLAETLGDAMRRADERSKVIAIADKDRGAIAPAGKRGTAYIYREDTGQFASTTYYMKEHPKWVTEFNAAKHVDRYVGAEWKPLLGEGAYARSQPGGKLPQALPAQAGPKYYGEVMGTPFGDDLVLQFARAAIAGEQLGRDGSPDLLFVSLSTHDYLNHAHGAESRISHDHILYIDRALQEFFNDLDVAIGRDNYVAVITADHGFTPTPELSKSLGRNAGRIPPITLLTRLNAGLVKKFGAGRWVTGFSAHALVLNHPLARSRALSIDEIAKETRELLAVEPGIAGAYTRAELEGGARPDDPIFEAARKSWHPRRSADLHLVLKPYWLLGAHTSGTTHGSPHPYDTNVPLLLYGPAWIPAAGRIDKRVEVSDIAPTLARILGVPPPAQSEGRPLPMDPLAR